jgi:type II secretory pathway component PulF
MDTITKSTRTIRSLSARMAKSKSTASEREACWKVIHQELAILDAQGALIAEALRLLGRQSANVKDQPTSGA